MEEQKYIFRNYMIVVVLLVGITAGVYLERRFFQKSAISAGIGQYNPQTGEFEWKR